MEGTEAASGMLEAVDVIDVVGALLRGRVRVKGGQQVEGGNDEEGEHHAAPIRGCVEVWEVSLEAADPVLDMSLFGKQRLGRV